MGYQEIIGRNRILIILQKLIVFVALLPVGLINLYLHPSLKQGPRDHGTHLFCSWRCYQIAATQRGNQNSKGHLVTSVSSKCLCTTPSKSQAAAACSHLFGSVRTLQPASQTSYSQTLVPGVSKSLGKWVQVPVVCGSSGHLQFSKVFWRIQGSGSNIFQSKRTPK